MIVSMIVACDVVGCGTQDDLTDGWYAHQHLGPKNNLATIHVCPTCRKRFEKYGTSDQHGWLRPFGGERPPWLKNAKSDPRPLRAGEE